MVLEARTASAIPLRGLDLIAHEPPGDLLPSGGSSPSAGAVPAGSLAEDALALLRTLRSTRRPTRWSAPAFVAGVALVRAHLVPILDRPSLLSSFEREAFHLPGGTIATTAARMSATRVAYAIRWLGAGRRRATTCLDGIARERRSRQPSPLEGQTHRKRRP